MQIGRALKKTLCVTTVAISHAGKLSTAGTHERAAPLAKAVVARVEDLSTAVVGGRGLMGRGL